MNLSPDGPQAVFVGPGPGRSTIAYHVDIAAGTSRPILKAGGNPERLRWCEFASDRRLVCRFYAMVQGSGLLLPSTRTISLNPNGTEIKELGQRASSFDVGFRAGFTFTPGGTRPGPSPDVHGDMDLNVVVAQSQTMDNPLKNAGKRSELVVFKGLDHALEDNDARALMLSKAAALLAKATAKAGG